jgi:hypothetical protein
MKKAMMNHYLYQHYEVYKKKGVILNKIKIEMISLLDLFLVLYIFMFGSLSYRYKMLQSLKNADSIVEGKIMKSYEADLGMCNYLETYRKLINNKKIYINQIMGRLNNNSFIIEEIISKDYINILNTLKYVISFHVYNLLKILRKNIADLILYYDTEPVNKKG